MYVLFTSDPNFENDFGICDPIWVCPLAWATRTFVVYCLLFVPVLCGLWFVLFAVFGFTPVERPWEAHFAYMPVPTPLCCVADLPDTPKLQKPILCPINLQQNKSECIQWGNFAFFWKVVAVLWRRWRSPLSISWHLWWPPTSQSSRNRWTLTKHAAADKSTGVQPPMLSWRSGPCAYMLDARPLCYCMCCGSCGIGCLGGWAMASNELNTCLALRNWHGLG